MRWVREGKGGEGGRGRTKEEQTRTAGRQKGRRSSSNPFAQLSNPKQLIATQPQLNERIYTLKADNVYESKKWVSTLNALKVGGQNELQEAENSKKGRLADIDKTGRQGGGMCGFMPCCV